jgi:hypothetical protein
MMEMKIMDRPPLAHSEATFPIGFVGMLLFVSGYFLIW